jgi:hypothetical protein
MPVPKNVTMLVPWREVPADEGALMDAQLQRELSLKHPLYGVMAKAVARTGARDDVLFELTGHEKPLADVHLTWSQKPLHTPKFPTTKFYATWEDWVEKKLIPDHEEYSL